MRSLCYTGPNQLELREAPKPEPKEGEVLLRVRACGICGSDVHGFLGLTGRRQEIARCVWLSLCLALSLLFLISQSYNPFIYFQF